MRKDALISLLKKYNKALSLDDPKSKQIKLLEQFLETDEIRNRDKSNDILFSEFTNYLTKTKHLSKTKINGILSNEESPAVNSLFNEFMAADNRDNNPFSLTEKVQDIRRVTQYLSPTDVNSLAATSHTLFSETKNIDYWKKNLLGLGCDITVLNDLINLNIITDFGELHKSLTRAKREYDITKMQLWEFISLSGNSQALLQSIRNHVITNDNKNSHHLNPLHYAAISGNSAAMETAMKLDIDPHVVDINQRNILHYAALSGSVDAIKLAIKSGIDSGSIDYYGKNALHYAAESGNPAAMVATCQLGIDPQNTDNIGMNALHYAASYGNPAVVMTAIELGVKRNSVDNAKANALHHAALNNDVATVDAIVKSGIDINRVDRNGSNALQIAIKRRPINMPVIEYILSLDIDINNKNRFGQTAADIVNSMKPSDAKLIKQAFSEATINRHKP